MKHKFLLVDNNSNFGESMKLMLSLAGHEVEWAVNGECAEKRLRNQTPEVILMDYRLGDTDGLTVARKIKLEPTFAHVRDVPIILSTAMDEQDLPVVVGQAVAAVLRKPYTLEQLMDTVERLTQKV